MSKICPNCKYPNPNHLNACFKCGTDISDTAMQEINRQRAQARETQRLARQTQNFEAIDWNIYNFHKLNIENENISYEGINYLNSLLSNIDKFTKIILILLILGIIGGVIENYHSRIQAEETRIVIAKDTNESLKQLYDQQMQSYRELIDLERQLGSSVSATLPSQPEYESEEFNPKVKEEALKTSIEIIIGAIYILLIYILVWWSIRSIAINTIELQKSIKNNFKSIGIELNNIDENLKFIKNYYNNYNNDSTETINTNTSQEVFPQQTEDAK